MSITGKSLIVAGVGLAALVAATNPTPAAASASMPQVKAGTTAQSTRAERLAARRAAREARRAERRRAREARIARTVPTREGSATVEGGDIIVTGLRQSVENSIQRKRNARQAVDIITSEDAGKLPDNNVVEAMARVTGITVTRSQGRANGFNIRGLAGVQTTVNGIEGATAPLPGGEGRSLSLESVPAELVKSIEVYKTRTADQIEGGVGGSVNIELRRPLDLRKGWTVAGGVRASYAEQGGRWSPSANLLVGNRFETGIGEIGFLLNGSYGKTRYAEAYNTSESPDKLGFDQARIRLSLPEAQRATLIAPYRASYGTNDGERTQKSLSGVLQWRASNELNFVLEGSYFGEEESNRFSSLYVRTREDNYVVSNLRIGASGALLGYDITNPPINGRAQTIVAGFEGAEDRRRTENFRTNFETHYAIDGLRIDGSVQYQWSNNSFHGIGHGGSYAGLSRVRVDFDSPKAFGGGPFFEFNVSPTDVNLARVTFLRDNLGSGENQQFSAQTDIWKQLSDDGFLRAGRFGARYARNTAYFQDGYRFAGYFAPELSLPFASIPGVSATTVTPDLPGGTPLSWVQLDNRKLYDNWDQVTKFITTSRFEFLDGPGRDAGAAALFGTVKPSSANPVYTSRSKENVFAAYGTLDFAFKAVFPIDGNVGVRYVNTWSNISGFVDRPGPRLTDPVTGLPNGQFGPNVTSIEFARGNYVDILPSAFALVHFTDKLQLRTSYSYNVQRPGLFSLRNFASINYQDPNAPVFAGNPALQPSTVDNYDAALEWFPAPGAIVSLGGFIKEQQGVIQYTAQIQPVPQLGGQNRLVFQERNVGPGKVRGIEAQATGFFRFLPGFLKNFGATANVTFIPVSNVFLPIERARANDSDPIAYDYRPFRAPFTSRWTYNLIGYYETPSFSARVAYNWRSAYQTYFDPTVPQWARASFATQRLDAAVNYTPVKYLTLSIEGQNLLRTLDREYYVRYTDLPIGLRAMGRTITGSARFRF